MPESSPDTSYTVPVPEDKAGTRLDRMLAEALPGLSRTRIKALIEGGLVAVVGGVASPGAVGDAAYKARAGQVFTVRVPAPSRALPEPEDIPLSVVYEDADLIVVDKPAGLVVHPGPGHADGTLVNALLAHCGGSLSGIGGVSRPGIVHRLDKDTSGLLVAAKNDAAHRGLARQFAEHSIERIYRAVVWGVPAPRRGEVAGSIGRSPVNRKKMAVVARGGKTALTRYRVERTLGTGASLVQCRLATGRTHQIRVHLASLGHPVIGDPLYGGTTRARLRRLPEAARLAVAVFGRQALHAYFVGFTQPTTGKRLRFESQLPIDIKRLLCCLDKI